MTMSFTRGVSLGGEGCQRTLTGDGETHLEISDASGSVGTEAAGAATSQAQVEPAGASPVPLPVLSGVGLGGKDKHADDGDRRTRVSEASDPDAAETCG